MLIVVSDQRPKLKNAKEVVTTNTGYKAGTYRVDTRFKDSWCCINSSEVSFNKLDNFVY